MDEGKGSSGLPDLDPDPKSPGSAGPDRDDLRKNKKKERTKGTDEEGKSETGEGKVKRELIYKRIGTIRQRAGGGRFRVFIVRIGTSGISPPSRTRLWEENSGTQFCF